MNSPELLPSILGFGTLVLGMIGLFLAILRSTAAIRSDLRVEVARLDSRIDKQGAELGGRMESLGARLDARMDRLEARMEKGFSELHADHRDLRSRVDRITDNLAIRGLFPTQEA